MKRSLILLIVAWMVIPGMAQYIPSQSVETPAPKKDSYWHYGNLFEHLDVSLGFGTTGIGIDLASPICEFIQVRIGYEYMPPYRRKLTSDVQIGNEKSNQYDAIGNRIESNFDRVKEMMYAKTGYDMMDHIDMTGTLTMNNFKFLVDVFPLSDNKNLHVTVGFYWGPSQIAKIENNDNSNATLMCVNTYNRMYDDAAATDVIKSYGSAGLLMGKYSSDQRNSEGTVVVKQGDDYKMLPNKEGRVFIPIKTNSFKPYLGVGYEAKMLKKRDDWKFAVTGGLIFWGGTPSIVTSDGINLAKDVTDITGKTGDYVSLMSKLKAAPMINVRIIKNIF